MIHERLSQPSCCGGTEKWLTASAQIRFIPAVLLLASSTLRGQTVFMRKDVPAGDRPGRVVVGDFNGDRRQDLAVSGLSGLWILLNRGGGTFTRRLAAGVDIDPMFGPTPADYPVAADFNRDGRLDLAGTTRHLAGRLLLGRGDGTFDERDVGPAAIIGTGDFNGDRVPDLVTEELDQQSAQRTVVILLGNGEGYFQRGAELVATTTPRVADFNRDGLSDLVANRPQGGFSVWLNRAGGRFAPPVTTLGADAGVIGDFNRDGVPDMASGTEVLLGNGDGTFQPVRYIPHRKGFPIPFAAADFDGDGHTDLAGSYSSDIGEQNFISVFRGRGDGTLSLPVDYAVGWQPTGQLAADLDGDGRPELITSNFRSSTLTLLVPTTASGAGVNRAVSSASGTAILAPESLSTIYVSTGASAAETAIAPYPSELAGIRLEVTDAAGAVRLAPLLFVSPTQINFQVPSGTAPGEAALAITREAVRTAVGSMQVEPVAPALFMVSHVNSTPAATGVRVSADGRQTPVAVFNCFGPVTSPFACGPAPIRLSNDTVYLSFFGTGFRAANLGNVTASINGVRVPVQYAGPQGTQGIDQINLALPPGVVIRPPAFISIGIDDVAANTALLQIIPAPPVAP